MNNRIFGQPAVIKAKNFTLITLILLIVFSCKVNAQLTQYSIGGPGNELATKIKYLPTDGSAIIAGYSYDITSGAATNCQAIIMKVTSTGTIAWQKTFGIPNTNNIIEDMTITQDNNIIVVGTVGGEGNAFANNTAAILKYNATTGNLMWQSCLNDAATTTGGELFFGVTELKDGTGRIVAVGSHNYTGNGAGSTICVFQSTGALIYNELYDIPNGDEFRSVTTSADGASVYICGEFVGNYKDGKVISYTPGASSGTVNWTQCFDYAALGTMVNNFFSTIYLSGSKLVVVSGNVADYSGAGGEVNGVITMNAADGSGAQIAIVQNSGAAFGNSNATAVASSDHVFFVQSPASASYDPAIVTPGSTSSSVITEITSLAASTANAPVKFVSSDVGQHSILDMNLQGNTLYLAGSTNVTNGFGNNDIYYVNTNTSLASLNHNCDTAHDIVSITTPVYTNSTPTFTLSSFTPVYTTVDTGSTNFSIAMLCGDIIQDTVCNTISLPDTVNGCANTPVSLNGTINGPDSVLSIHWSPATGLSDTNTLNPIVTAINSGWYNLTVESLIQNNLIVNGAFSNGNTGFSSGCVYNPVAPPSGQASIPGNYAVATNPFPFNNSWPTMGDHTTGNGNMLLMDADTTAGTSFWCETVPVIPNTNYLFSVWSALLYPPLPTFQLTINGISAGSTFSTTNTQGQWVQYQIMWNSDTSTSASICLTDLNVTEYGNDFAIDDIAFQQLCTATDSIYVMVNNADTAYARIDTVACSATGSISITAPSGYASYTWSTGATTPAINVNNDGTYWVHADSADCHTLIDSIHVDIKTIPVVHLGNDTSICAGNLLTLSSVQPIGATYLWSDGNANNSIMVSGTGTYWLSVTDSGCNAADSIHITQYPIPIVNLGPDTAVCGGQTTLQSATTYTGATYQWNTGAATSNINVTTSGTYSLSVTQNNCTGADTVSVDLKPIPVVHLGNDTSICAGNSLTLSSVQPNGAMYLWSDGSANNSITVSATGTYWLSVTDSGCNAADSIHIIQYPIPTVNLGPDTAVCGGQTTLQSATAYTGATYQWNTGAATSNINVTTSGTYSLSVTQNNCTGTDTVSVDLKPIPVVHLGNDTSICEGVSLMLSSVQPSGAIYLWSDASTNNSITVSATGIYWLSVTDSGCNTADSINITQYPMPTVNLGPDTTACEGQAIVVQSAVAYTGATYEWNTGSTTPQLNITASGTYWLAVTKNNCTGADTISVAIKPLPLVNIGADTAICPYDTLTLGAPEPAGISYLWSTGSTDSSIKITSSGIYSLTVSANGCAATDSVQVTDAFPPMPNIGQDTTLCPGQVLTLQTDSTNATSYLWSDGSTGQSLAVSQTGIYWVLLANQCGTASDTISVDYQYCDIWFPSAFTPNNDGRNDIIKVVGGLSEINDFKLAIYNRWGQMVFNTVDKYSGWDGKLGGVPQPLDTYNYMIQYSYNGKTYMMKGNFELIR